MTATWRSSSEAASPCSTATATAARTCTSRAVRGPAALYRNDSPVGGSLRFSAVPDPATDLTRVTGAYPLDIDGDGQVDLAVLRDGENVLLRGLGDCRFERANEALGLRRRHGLDHGLQRHVGRLGRPCRRWPSATTSTRPHTDPRRLCDDNELVRPAPSGTGFAPADPPDAGLVHAVDAVQRLGSVGTARPAGQQRSPLLPDGDGEEQLWRVAPGQPPRLYTDADGWVPFQLWGMGIASYDVTGDGYPEVFLTSQGDNKLQTLTDRPGQPTYRDIGLKRGVNAAQPFTGGDTLPSTAWHPGVPGRQQRRLHRPVHLQGQRQRAAGLRPEGPQQPAPGSARRDVHGRRRRSRDRGVTTRAAAPRWSISTSTACSTWSRSTAATR